MAMEVLAELNFLGIAIELIFLPSHALLLDPVCNDSVGAHPMIEYPLDGEALLPQQQPYLPLGFALLLLFLEQGLELAKHTEQCHIG